ncbi:MULTISPECIES: DUF1493 family protein [Flavobacterium]|uniref:DUF1493 family protein n=1 Tax=Flavobacterium TaxID=237 RepID=UPI000964FA39|nr:MULTISPECIES: DUF1493 family protein [Flavobacterium]MBN9284147.1 DUF1493 family protein [Flavobacterium sp.]OJV71158.1 MAG: hypothetical protein BGO42_04945 [Flavobacterium sp. 40-81]
MSKTGIFENIKQFIIRERWEYDFPLTRDTSIQEDLLIYGDDAVEFIVKFGKEFSVNVSNFMAADYFRAEGGINLPPVIAQLFPKKNKGYKELTIGDLEKAVIAGKLDEEVLNKNKPR